MLTRNRLSTQLPKKLAGFGELVAPGIGLRTAVAEAVLVGQTVMTYAPRSKAAPVLHLHFDVVLELPVK